MGKEPIKEQNFQNGDLYQSGTKEPLIKQTERKEYRSLQTGIRKRTESRYYKTKFKEPLPDNNGFVDVFLERHGKKIACKVFITGEEELDDIEKYINARYETVVCYTKDLKALEKIQIRVRKQLSDEIQDKGINLKSWGGNFK